MQFIYHGRLIKFYDRSRELTDMHGRRYHIRSDRIFDHYVTSHVVAGMATYVQTNTTDATLSLTAASNFQQSYSS